ncbi:glycoside hydrolase family 31 protein [Amanita thiersii Skay4041]|uniref:alpha-D-xyloside xylohydrolase n=1 Tax=Amanita thiersii Skay4041 TaxID=703135 RepID=A0A2A9NIR9_9AGAR|nr:glycoside hydrolase family 31 protein [Amanita thiersii Skay4041]
MKFSQGMWWLAEDVTIDWAVEAVKSEAKQDSIRCLASSKHIRHRGDTLNTPTITFECSSPFPGIALLTAYHWKAQETTLSGPHYELYPDIKYDKLVEVRNDSPQTSKTDKVLKLSTNSLSVVINTQPKSFNVDFISHGAKNPTSISKSSDYKLTGLGWRSVGYVRRGTNLHASSSLSDPDKGERWMTMQFHISVNEKIFGLGERFGPFIKNGQTVEMWNEDGGTSSEKAYKNVPFLLSSRGYGIFIPCSGFVSFEVQSERTTRSNIAVPYESMSAYIIHGPTPSAIIKKYTLLTGRPALPPPWTFGLWLSTSFTTNYDEETVNKFLDGMKEREIPVEVFHFDCFWQKGFQWCDYKFDPDNFPDPEGQLKRLKDKGYKICVWINSYIAQESEIFVEGVKNGYFLRKADGSVWQFDFWQAGMAFVDFTNPEACKWYQSKLQKLLDMGVDCFKTDFGERIPTGNVVYHDGSNPGKMHNYYSFLYNKTTFELLERHMGRNKAVVFARSATAGGQRFPVHWGGDPMSTFDAMAETLRGGLSLGLCGFGFWAHDIGGFEGTPDPALYKRWFAFGALSSHTRLHGSGSYRVPWLIDPSGEADQVLKHFTQLKLALMPYLYATAIKTHETGVPIMRPMFVEFPEDPVTWTLDTQYMLGPDLLVAPVFSGEEDEPGGGAAAAAQQVQYYVPRGRWYGLLDGKVRVGPGYVVESHGFMSVPLLVRPGSVVAWMGGGGGGSSTTRAVGQNMGVVPPARALPSLQSPTYDYAKGTNFLINRAEPCETLVNVPDSQNPGDIAACIKVKSDEQKVTIQVLNGALKDTWTVTAVDGEGVVRDYEFTGDFAEI